MVVTEPSKTNRSQRPFEDKRQERNGNAKVVEEAKRYPRLLYCPTNQFERWLVKRFGPEYLEPVQLYKDGGGI